MVGGVIVFDQSVLKSNMITAGIMSLLALNGATGGGLVFPNTFPAP